MKNKLFTLIASALVSASMFAVAPTVANLASIYDVNTNVVFCVQFIEDAEVCNDVHFVGSCNNWGKGEGNTESWDNCEKFAPVPGFEDWYAVEIPYGVGFQGKPLQEPNDRSWTWNYQCGDVASWVHVDGLELTIEASYIGGECNISAGAAGAYIYQLKYWKSHKTPCIKNLSVTCDPNQGSVTGGGQYPSKIAIISAVPNNGYHFVQWSDGDTNNPRTIELTQDTTFNAEFALDLSGLCGKDSALSWGYEPESAVLTISGNGELTENYTFSVVAKTMKTLILNEGITSIGKVAFRNSSNLTDVTLPSSLTEIGRMAFRGDSLLSSVTIPENVTIIGTAAFGECISLQTITIPENVSNLASGATFQDCTGLKSVVWNAINCTLSQGEDPQIYVPFIFADSITSFTFGPKVETIPQLLCAYRVGLTEITIPNSVTTIGNYAFSNCTGLTSIELPNSVTTIGSSIFSGCTGLVSVTIPSSATNEGTTIAQNTTNLKVVNAPISFFDVPETYWTSCPKYLEQVTVNSGELNDNAFGVISRSYKTLEQLDIAAVTNTSLADEAFKSYYNLTSLALPENLEYLGYMSVADCKSLQAIVIPASVREIDNSAFENCRSLSQVVFAENSQLERIGNWAFYNCHTLQTLEIPEGVTEIGDGAFYGCVYLENLTLPSSVQAIGDNAFALCSKLNRMDVDAIMPPSAETKTFYEVSCTAPVYVPDESVDLYKNDPIWGELNIVGKSQVPQAIDQVDSSSLQGGDRGRLILRNGQILILRGDKTYTLQGQELR